MAQIDEALDEVEFLGEEVALVQVRVNLGYLALGGDGVLTGPALKTFVP